MEFLDNPQDLCLDNTHCRDDYCTKNHPRCLEGICIGYLKQLCQNQTQCDLLHYSRDELEEILTQPINGYYQFNICPKKCQNMNCRFSHPKWLPQICFDCLKKQNCDKTNQNLWHFIWVRVKKEVYKLYNREGINPENFCDDYESCQCIAAQLNFNVNCIRYYKGVCLQIRCLYPHITWENSSQQISQNQQIIVNSCIHFDAEQQQFIQRKQTVSKSQIYVPRNQLSQLIQNIRVRPQIDILFIIDSTKSMTNWLDIIRDNVYGIIQQFKQKVPVESSVRTAVVCYKDYGEKDHINYCDFTTNAEKIQEFLSQQNANGGADIPDDLVGALKQAYKLNISKDPMNILQMFIITDAPCHGKRYHKLNLDSKLDGDGLEKILSKFQQKKQRFYLAFMQLSDQTKQMEECVKKCVFNFSPTKLEPQQFGDYIKFTLQSSFSKAYQIQELQEIYDYIPTQFTKMNQIIEPYDNRNQQLSYLEYIENQIMQHQIIGQTQLQFEKNEFEVKEKGVESIVHKGFDQKNNQNIILKIPRFIINLLVKGHPIDTKDIQNAEMLAKFRFRNQIVSLQLAAQFNKIQHEKKKDRFVPLYFPSPILYTLEQPIFGLKLLYGEILIEDENITWTKYSNNFEFFQKDDDLTTFSHFTYVATNHQVLVNDLQGYLNILTDPAVQTQKLNDQQLVENEQQQEIQDFQPITDFNEKGIEKFFECQHQNCSDLCKIIGLDQRGNQRTIFAEKLRQNQNLLFMCQNCCSFQKYNTQNLHTLCDDCEIKNQSQTEITCKCCKAKFLQKQKFDQLRSSCLPFCKECLQQQCQDDMKQCIYCQKKVCKRKRKFIKIKQQEYFICLDAFNYLRQQQCKKCPEKYAFDQVLSKEDYSQGNYVCQKHQ